MVREPFEIVRLVTKVTCDLAHRHLRDLPHGSRLRDRPATRLLLAARRGRMGVHQNDLEPSAGFGRGF
jgi:hypothetical protein